MASVFKCEKCFSNYRWLCGLWYSSPAIFNLLAGICFIAGVLGYMNGVCSGYEAWMCLIGGFVSFLIPHVVGVLIADVDGVNLALWGFIKS